MKHFTSTRNFEYLLPQQCQVILQALIWANPRGREGKKLYLISLIFISMTSSFDWSFFFPIEIFSFT